MADTLAFSCLLSLIQCNNQHRGYPENIEIKHWQLNLHNISNPMLL